MYAINAPVRDLHAALRRVNALYEGNVRFAIQPTDTPKGVKFTLAVNDSNGKGARRGIKPTLDGSPRKLAFACWHVHGHLFDALFALRPHATITSKLGSIKAGEKWQDLELPEHPGIHYSDLCECKPASKRHVIFSHPRKVAKVRRSRKKERGSLIG